MLYEDREEAGRALAAALGRYRGPATVVLALPRGGVVVGRVIADALGCPLDVVVPRKIGAPGHEEYAIGAVTESGKPVWNEAERARVEPAVLDAIVQKEQAEAHRRLGVYREGLPPRDLRGKTVILVDDGLATGFTMRAAIQSVREARPEAVIVAAPVAPPQAVEELRPLADGVVVLETPEPFFAIGGFYAAFPQVDDATVMRLLRPREQRPKRPS